MTRRQTMLALGATRVALTHAITRAGVIFVIILTLASCTSDRAASDAPGQSPTTPRVTYALGGRRARLASAARVRRAEPVVAPENLAFYYQAIPASAGPGPLAKLGSVRTIVAGFQRDSPGTAATIRSTGALAFRYFQTYWYPRGHEWQGLDIGKHRDWAFCRTGSKPAVGRTDRSGIPWLFLDMNERAVHAYFTDVFRRLVADGWNGVFFDRGYAALAGIDRHNYRIWNRQSSCTDNPVLPGATFADSFLQLPALARAAGLRAIINYGVSPFDASTPMRPDPRRASCAARQPSCPTRHDVWATTNQVLNESIGQIRHHGWRSAFVANRLSEQDLRFGGRTVGLVTSGHKHRRTSGDVYYRWTRAKLFAIPLAVNTGDHGCAKATGPCDRNGLYPDLASTTFGPPVDPQPVPAQCEPHSRERCIWRRRYTRGLSVINAGHTVKRIDVELGVPGCRYVLDVASGSPLGGSRCVRAVTLRILPQSGRPLQYSTAPF